MNDTNDIKKDFNDNETIGQTNVSGDTGGTDEDSTSKKKESTRTRIAQVYVYGFFITILVVFLIGFFKKFAVNDYKDLLVAVSGILSGPLGFIVGYYFKASKE